MHVYINTAHFYMYMPTHIFINIHKKLNVNKYIHIYSCIGDKQINDSEIIVRILSKIFDGIDMPQNEIEIEQLTTTGLMIGIHNTKYIYLCIHMYAYIKIYIHVHLYIYTHIYIHIFIYIHVIYLSIQQWKLVL
jgi:hypothetical protein